MKLKYINPDEEIIKLFLLYGELAVIVVYRLSSVHVLLDA